jgi:nucleoside-diphosphate-sugar epimerase
VKVLFIGGTGTISTACSKLAVERGIELYLLNRGESKRPVPGGAKVLTGDIRQPESVRSVLGDLEFDAVVDWVAFKPEQVQLDIQLFKERTGQYVFISSASAYQTPPGILPASESTPLHNPYWQYSRDKAACEALLMKAYQEQDFPATIVRPSHTYDRTSLPFRDHYTTVARMRAGRKVVVHGDGTSLWTLTHSTDYAVGFVGLLAHPLALGEAFHITSDEWLSWNRIYELVAKAAGATPQLVHVPSELIAAFDPDWGASLLGDKSHSMLFDNSKIRRLVPDFNPSIPYTRGVREVIDWYDADPERQQVDPAADDMHDRIIAAMESIYP